MLLIKSKLFAKNYEYDPWKYLHKDMVYFFKAKYNASLTNLFIFKQIYFHYEIWVYSVLCLPEKYLNSCLLLLLCSS